MSLGDELQKLADLYDDGVLTEAEFAEAKRQLLQPPPPNPAKPTPADPLGSAVDRYVDFQIAGGVIGFAVFIIWVAFVVSRTTH